ncbi:MAG: gas vesicle protein K [Vicinamibacterales bacterium]
MTRKRRDREPERPPRATPRTGATRAAGGHKRTSVRAKSPRAAPVTASELRALQRELQRRVGAAGPSRPRDGARWNPDPEDVQKSVAQLVLTIVEFLRQLMERQAIRRMEAQTLTPEEIEGVGVALMRLEETVRDMAARFGLAPEDLNLDLGPITLR